MAIRMVLSRKAPAWGSMCSVLSTFALLCATLGALAPSQSFASPAKKVRRGEEIVVSFKPPVKGASARSTRQVQNLAIPGSMRLKRVSSQGSIGVVSASVSASVQDGAEVDISDADVARLCDSIVAKNRNVPVICEANTLFSASAVPNDPSYNVLYGMTKIQAPAAWDISTGSKSVVVAVIDTGVQYTHPDLSANIAVNSGETPNNGVDDDRNGYTDDYYGYDFINNDGNPMDDHYHGTHCAGTVGAKGNNGVGVAGVAWNVSILPVKVLDGYGSGTLASVAAGINYATARGAKILSMSLGGGSSSTTLENAISAARQSGVMIVAAAGNSGLNTDYYPSYPASSPQDNVVAVAATDSSDTKASWSNYGPASVDVAAPGVSIYSTLLGNSYDYLSGTSMATPHVAGMVAVLRSVNSNLSYLQLKNILIQTSDPVSSLNGKIVSNGRVNLYKAALAAQNGATPSPTPTATPTPTPPVDPTGTPDPTPTEPPADEPTREISIRVERMRRNVYVFGEVTDFEQDTGVRSARVTLVCNSRVVGTRTTDEDGYYEFVMRRPTTKITCYVEDDSENRSRRLRFR